MKYRVVMSVLAIAIFATMAQAQATRTWVSGVGDDANPCSRTAPCKTWAGAISKTFTAGEIDALDPGSYGALTINKSITIDGSGQLAGSLASGGNGFNINILTNANDPFRQVILRNISINGTGASGSVGTRTGINGVNIHTNGAATVQLENVLIQNFSQNGILINLSSAVNLNLNNVEIKNCSLAGISAETTAGFARVTMRNSSVANCGTGIHAKRNSRVALVDSSFSLNATGLLAEGILGTAVVVAESCQIANNTGSGVQAGSASATHNSTIRLSNNIINNNAGTAVSIQGMGTVETFQNNKIIGNNPDGCVGCVSVTANID